jgi:hypothetical protein
MHAAVKNGDYTLDEMKELAKKFQGKNTANFNGIKGDIGEGISDLVHKANYPDYTSMGKVHINGNQGFDGVYIKYASDGTTVESVRIVEAKYGTAGLGSITRDGRKIRQMSNEWIDDVISRMLQSTDKGIRDTAKIVRDSKDAGTLFKVLDNISKETGEVASKLLP